MLSAVVLGSAISSAPETNPNTADNRPEPNVATSHVYVTQARFIEEGDLTEVFALALDALHY